MDLAKLRVHQTEYVTCGMFVENEDGESTSVSGKQNGKHRARL